MKASIQRVLTACAALAFAASPVCSVQTAAAFTGTGISVSADAESENEYTYQGNVFRWEFVDAEDQKKGIRMSSVSVQNENVVLPDTVPYEDASYPVTALGNDFAAYDKTITALTIPATVTQIGGGICYNSPNLSSVTYTGPGLTELGPYPFCGTGYRNELEKTGLCILSNVLYYVDIEGFMENGTKLDLSCSRCDDVTIVTAIIPDTLQTMIFPKNCYWIPGYINKLFTNLRSIQYYRPETDSWVEFRDVIKAHVEQGTELKPSDTAFIEQFGQSYFASYDFGNPESEPYKLELIQILGKKFLAECDVPYYGGVKPDLTPWQQYDAVRKIILHCRNTIRYQAAEDGGSGSFFVELLLHKGIVCQNFARLNLAMLMCAGVEARYLFSVAEGNHAWNIVNIGGKWFNVDATATWNVYHRTFMVPDEVIAQNYNDDEPYDDFCHTRHAECREAPACTTQTGDVTEDGGITVEDAQTTLNAAVSLLAGTDSGLSGFQEVLCDVDCDGAITVADAQMILCYYSVHTLAGTEDRPLEVYIDSSFPGSCPK